MNDNFATFAGGCFWCTEAIFLELKGVKSVVSGYLGGTLLNPTYQDICTGSTGHAEAVQINFDPEEISFSILLEVFFATHDPTTLNRQGADKGTQYRSEIFYHSEEQRKSALAYMHQLEAANIYDAPIVTRLSPVTTFYSAESYHQKYYQRNKEQSYCYYVITPKMNKLSESFTTLLK